jgi:hypothetical protein
VSVACDSPTSATKAEVAIDGASAIQFASLGEAIGLTASVRGGNTADLVWRSTNATVASVDRSGIVTAVSDGNAKVIASIGASADSVTVIVSQEAVALRFVAEPDHVVREAPFPGPISVAVVDALGNAVSAATSVMAMSLLGGTGSLNGTVSQVSAGGVAVFDDLSVTAEGTGYRLRASVGSGEMPPFVSESVPFDVVETADLVLLRNGSASPSGLLVDGRGAGGVLNDRGYVVADSTLMVVLAAAPESNEVLAFTERRPPILASAPWTDAPDTIVVDFPARIEIPITIWIVRGPFVSQQPRAAEAITTTSSIWDAERMGIAFSEVEYVDATANADASALFDQTVCNQQSRTTTSIGQRPGRINVYYVANVDGGAGRGRACGPSFIIMGERSGHELLAHEIGHSFGLGHVDGDSHYDQTNVMHSASNVRQYLTEGQVFRSHYNSFSALRSVYAARTEDARNCPHASSTAGCPALERRLWPDGNFVSGAPPTGVLDAAVEKWLFSQCGVGEDPFADQLLRTSRIVAESQLLAILERAASRIEPEVRLRAIEGLGIVGGNKARAGLAMLAADSASPYASAARAAIEAIDARQR